MEAKRVKVKLTWLGRQQLVRRGKAIGAPIPGDVFNSRKPAAHVRLAWFDWGRPMEAGGKRLALP
jgi:hypothetical protein